MNDPVQVLRITPHWFRPGIWPVAYDPSGGLQIQTWRMTMALEKKGISQTVLTSYIPGYPRRSIHSDTLKVECPGGSLSEYFASKLMGVTWFFGVLRWLLKHRAGYELIHIHYNHSIWCRILTVIAHRLKTPVIVSLNTELWVSHNHRWLVSSRFFNLSLWIEKWAIKLCDTVIVLTQIDAARCTNKLKVKPERILVIPDVIDIESFQVQMSNDVLNHFRQQFNIPLKKKIVVYIGRIRHEKGWEDLPSIVSELDQSDAFMLICGDGPDCEQLKNALADAGCLGNWSITGFISPKQVKMALQIADVLILPSRREAFGGVLLEAMASGVPTVAYAVGGIVEVSGEPPAIWLTPSNNRVAFTQAIVELLNDPGQAKNMIEQGYRRVEDFSVEHAAEETMMCYKSVLRYRY